MRNLLLVCLLVAFNTKIACAGNPNRTRVGAIRWDAWYNLALPNPGAYVASNLMPSQYQFRLPFCTIPISPNRVMSTCNTQTSIDAEIAYAKSAGIKFWAYNWGRVDDPMLQAWSLHQSSVHLNDVNWCIITSYSALNHSTHGIAGYYTLAQLVSLFNQTNYERYGIRPIIFLLQRNSPELSTVAEDIKALRNASSAAGVGNPYVVIMSSNPNISASDMVITGADAISSYNGKTPGTRDGSYATLDKLNRAFWGLEASTGKPVIPTGVLGWDRRPRIERPVPWEVSVGLQRVNDELHNYYATATAAEIATHVEALLSWVENNASSVPSNHALLYAWDENDEGGWLVPTYTPSGPDQTRLKALSSILQ